jgi:hypothetical protein
MSQPSPVSPLWRNWVLACSGAMVASGALMVFAPDANAVLFNYISFYQPQFPASFSTHSIDYIKFISTVLGAVMMGWGIMTAQIGFGPFARGEPQGWNSLAIPITSWFIIDSLFSFIRGYPGNVGFNLVFFVPVTVPLIATYRHFFPNK